MNALVVYSSQSGNTRKLARAIGDTLPAGTRICAVDEAPDPGDYDFVALGFWLQAGKPDPKSSTYLERLKSHKNLFLYATHGARPGSDHAEKAMQQARSLADGANVSGTFSCFGEVNPKVIQKAKSKPQPPVWLDDAPDATGHPNAADLENLSAALQTALK